MANNYEEFSEVLEIPWGYDGNIVREALKEHLEDNGDEEAAFTFELNDKGLWIYSEGFGDPYKAADFASRVMKKFKMKGHFAIRYCFRCDRPKPGEFGGGIMIITVDGVKALNINDYYVNEISTALESGAKVSDDVPAIL